MVSQVLSWRRHRGGSQCLCGGAAFTAMLAGGEAAAVLSSV